MDIKLRTELPPSALTLPAKYYTSAECFDREMERFYAAMWVCVGREEDVATPGDFTVREVAGESLVLVRDDRGLVNAFHNVCRHRGTRVCDQNEGHATSLQCPYHGWTYALDGTLIGAPHMDGTAGFDRAAYPLHRAACETWDGHVFVSLAAHPASLMTQLAGLPLKFAPWRMQDLRRGAAVRYDVRANWKLIIQNYSECLHCPVIHPVLNGLSHYLSGENEPLQPTYLGGRMDLREGMDTMSMDGKRRRPWLPALPAPERRHVYYYAILPNLLLTLAPDHMMTHTLWPQACDRTIVDVQLHFHPEALAAPGGDPTDVAEFWDMTNRQDWHVSELAQQGISSRAYRPGPYSSREDLLYAFDRFIVSVHEPKARQAQSPTTSAKATVVRRS